MKKCEFCQCRDDLLDLNNNYLLCTQCLNSALKDYSKKINSTKNINIQKKKKIYEEELSQYVVTFGKYRGKNILDIEPSYIKWCLNNFHNLRDEELFKKALEHMTGERINKIKVAQEIIEKSEERAPETGFEF